VPLHWDIHLVRQERDWLLRRLANFSGVAVNSR